MTIIAITNHKGGTGKTTTAINLARGLTLEGKKVLVIDMDPQANLGQHVGVEQPDMSVYDALCEDAPLPIADLGAGLFISPAGIDLAGAEEELRKSVNGYFKLRGAIQKLEQPFDYILIDCPPSLGILTINALIAADSVIIPAQSQYFSIKGLQTIFDLIEELRENLNPKLSILGILLTQVTYTVINRTIEESMREGYGELVFNTCIRQNVALTEASYTNQTVFEYNGNSAGAEDYRKLTKEILHG